MLDVMDLIVAPLTELNPIKYWLDASYRARKKHELGIRTKRILGYQLIVFALVIVVIMGVINYRW